MTSPAVSVTSLRSVRLGRVADGLAIAVAVSLPWSTSATSVLVALWLVAIIPTLDFATLKRTLLTPAGGLPVFLVLFAAIGMLWADVAWAARIDGVSAFIKLLVIPLLMVQFRQSDWGQRVLAGFLVASSLLLVLSWVLVLYGFPYGSPFPGLSWQPKGYGIPVKDYISQSGIFTICGFALLDRALIGWREGRQALAIGSVLLALMFFANIFFIETSRTTLVVIPILVVLFGILRLGAKQMLGLLFASCMLAAVIWTSSPYLRFRVMHLAEEVQTTDSSAGFRISFWTMSLHALQESPIIGHGTGSIADAFRRQGSGTAVNPHNQMFAVGIQLGSLGIAILIAMWLVHWRLFFDPVFVAWPGLVVVTQNIVSSLFNSHLSDFTHGWIYAFGVGVIGGMLLRTRSERPADSQTVAQQ
jgi:O-antigen ligase